MSKSLKRLLTLRERLKKAAESSLQGTHNARARELACIDDVKASAPGQTESAASLMYAQQVRDAAHLRVAKLDQVAVQQKLVLSHAKRDLRQIEKLVEGHTQRQQERQLQQELREQEDWFRAKDHKEDQP